jgi:hypothetical protein
MNIKIEVYARQDELPVRGNASAISDEIDREIENEILERLNDGDIWAWALVEVRATDEDSGDHESEFIGGCCYKNEGDFKIFSGYYGEMAAAAAVRLIERRAAISA